MPQVEVRYDTSADTLRRFIASKAFVQPVMGPMASGKTSAFVFKLLKLICGQAPGVDGVRRSRWIVTRNTYPDLTNTTIRDWREIVTDDMGSFSNGHPPEHKLRFVMEDGTRVESDVIFIALDRADHVKKLRGVQATGAWMNEGKEQPKAVLDMLTLRVDRYPKHADGGCTWAGVLIDYNAPDEDHWLYELESDWRQGKLPDYEFFIQPGAVIKVGDKWVVNPAAENLKNLRPGYYERGMQGKSEDWIKVNLGNQYGFVIDGQPVYPEYIDSLHCAPCEPIPGVKIMRGWDFGLMPACVFTQATPDGRWIVFDELVPTEYGMGIHEFAQTVNEYSAKTYGAFEFEDYGDPAGNQRSSLNQDREEKTAFDILRGAGIRIQPSEQNITIRTESVKKPLNTLSRGKPQLTVSPRCKKLRKGFQGGYHYRKVQVPGTDRFHEEPDKNEYSHPHDALQYVGVKVFGRAVRAREERETVVVLQYEEVVA